MTHSVEPGDSAVDEPRTERAEQSQPLDRGISPIAGRFGGRGSKVVTLAALGLGCAVFLFATWDRGDGVDQGARDGTEPARQLVPFEPARRDTAPPTLTDASQSPDAPTLTSTGERVPAIEARSTEATGGPSAAERHRALLDEARRAPVLAYSRQGARGEASSDLLRTTADPKVVSAPVQARVTALDSLRQGSVIGEARAGVLSDRNLLLTAGASIPCILQTAMDSATPGFVSCILPRDIYSENGAVVLMERGTRVLGEYQGGLQQGRSRLFVLWTRAVTPAGVTVGLASPAADALGRAGFDGRIDTHFWDRFGGALLLSLVDDGLYAAVGRDSAVRDTARVPSDAAGIALQNSVDIPPTLRKAQGSEVSIFVAQDLNFSGVYRLRAR
ncbi:type IV secretion system protein VirB10 [Brevundimonas sp.]|jgi:type IV secretion system protein VirB10|uniref:type IV secretion system protein VirB10 n=1 Tax=Brevundimonas sp. TaxID=1871086 RepID=UPI0037C1B2BA